MSLSLPPNELVDGVIDIILAKGVNSETWWDCVQVGHDKIDVKAIDGAKYLDDSILKKIYAQVRGLSFRNSPRQKQEQKKQAALDKEKAAQEALAKEEPAETKDQ